MGGIYEQKQNKNKKPKANLLNFFPSVQPFSVDERQIHGLGEMHIGQLGAELLGLLGL